ncbi:MAG TPA: NAD-dependent epimerase/dehydratase family protein [Ktedonobacteraceae bacterium]|nr:NAD-dependent epimerase/dehydratase family protein [Ktedonobacteraceae bacterium]
MEMLVTGGTGFLGKRLAAMLLYEGHHVRIMGRNMASVSALLAQGAMPFVADLRDKDAVMAACAGVDVVFHAGALSAPWGKRADFFAINVGGTEAVLAGCKAHGVKRVVYVSSPSVVFDGGDQQLLTEDAPYPRRFASVYSLTKKLGEDRVRVAAAWGLETVIVRPKAIFGPGDTSLLPRLIDAARRGRLPQIGDGRNLVDLTYVDNVAHAMLLASASKAVVHKTYTITNDAHVPLWEVIRVVLWRLSLSAELRRVPLPVALAAASVMEWRAALTGKEPLLTRYSAAILARTQTYDISAAKRDLGYAPPVSIEEGIEKTLRALEEQV